MEALRMDLKWTDEQNMLRDAVRTLCAAHSSPEKVRALEDSDPGFDPGSWAALRDMDILGLTIPEAHGGAGQSALENVVIYEEFGRALVSSPHLVSSVLAAKILEFGSSEAAREEWLPRVASGEAILTCAWHEPDATAPGPLGTRKILVPFASSATAFLVVAPDGVHLVTEGVRVEAERTMASDAMGAVVFEDASGLKVAGPETLEEAMQDVLIAVGAYCVGGAQRAHELAVEYAKERVQFDRPIGSFQGVAHPLADTATEILGAETLVHEAAWARASGRQLGPLVYMAKYAAAEAFRHVTRVGHQTFGGIGFTLDIDMQLYYRRAKQLELLWLEPGVLEERIAKAELDNPTPFVSTETGGGS
jgi:alkylation response protein AidB-like acyl-CoA dehydrogenase